MVGYKFFSTQGDMVARGSFVKLMASRRPCIIL